jgi:hypothetical protein
VEDGITPEHRATQGIRISHISKSVLDIRGTYCAKVRVWTTKNANIASFLQESDGEIGADEPSSARDKDILHCFSWLRTGRSAIKVSLCFFKDHSTDILEGPGFTRLFKKVAKILISGMIALVFSKRPFYIVKRLVEKTDRPIDPSFFE